MISSKAYNLAIELIIEGEGFQGDVYEDTLGYLTIGYGHKLLNHEIGKLNHVSRQEAYQIMVYELEQAVVEAKSCWGAHLNSLNAERTAVILDMTYNLGSIRADKWPKFNQAVRSCNWEQAAKEIMNSKYARQVKSRAVRNSAIMRDGKMHKK